MRTSKVKRIVNCSTGDIVKLAAFGEIGKDVTNETGSKNYYLTDNQSKSIQKYLNTKPYVLIYGIGAPSHYGKTSKEASNVYCIIYQKNKDSKPWYYDGKKWTYRYLWRKDREGNPEKDSTRAMYVDNLNYTDRYHNRMKDVKDKNGYDTAVCLYYAYVTGNTVTSNPNGSFWRTLKDASE